MQIVWKTREELIKEYPETPRYLDVKIEELRRHFNTGSQLSVIGKHWQALLDVAQAAQALLDQPVRVETWIIELEASLKILEAIE